MKMSRSTRRDRHVRQNPHALAGSSQPQNRSKPAPTISERPPGSANPARSTVRRRRNRSARASARLDARMHRVCGTEGPGRARSRRNEPAALGRAGDGRSRGEIRSGRTGSRPGGGRRAGWPARRTRVAPTGLRMAPASRGRRSEVTRRRPGGRPGRAADRPGAGSVARRRTSSSIEPKVPSCRWIVMPRAVRSRLAV